MDGGTGKVDSRSFHARELTPASEEGIEAEHTVARLFSSGGRIAGELVREGYAAAAEDQEAAVEDDATESRVSGTRAESGGRGERVPAVGGRVVGLPADGGPLVRLEEEPVAGEAFLGPDTSHVLPPEGIPPPPRDGLQYSLTTVGYVS